MVWCLSMRWNMAGQMNESMQPVKLPMNPMRRVKWGITTANRIVTTTMPTRKARP